MELWGGQQSPGECMELWDVAPPITTSGAEVVIGGATERRRKKRRAVAESRGVGIAEARDQKNRRAGMREENTAN